MLQIAGTPVQADELTEFEPGSLEYEIVQKMADSETVYGYQSLQDLRFELQFRREIVRGARALEKSGPRFADFENTRGNPAYWEVTEQGGLQLKEGVSPATGIRDIFANGRAYAFECATAMTIVLYRAFLEVLGEAAFNRLFAGLYLFSWYHDQDLHLTTARRPDYFPGDIRYVKNPEVNPETPEWQGENVVVLGDDLYYGHGIGITGVKRIIHHLNKHRRPGATQSAYLMDNATRPDFQAVQQYVRSADEEGRFVPGPKKKPSYLNNVNPSIPHDEYVQLKKPEKKVTITVKVGGKTFQV
ncbi:MAG: protein-glutamine gamma-glutamyltransferase [Bacillaceae bacterium]|nr:protein-glutamine gamma-glutamyltransferase [Bacillaceae bacterium]